MLCLLLLTAAVFDMRTHRVPNVLTIGGMAVGLLAWGVRGYLEHGTGGAWEGLGVSFVGLASALVPFAIIYALGGLGGGDVKLMGALGAITGDWRCVVAAAFYALLLAAAWACVVMFKKRIVGRTLGRIASAAMFVMARVKPTIPDDGPRVPFALMVAVGGVLAGLQYLLGIAPPWGNL